MLDVPTPFWCCLTSLAGLSGELEHIPASSLTDNERKAKADFRTVRSQLNQAQALIELGFQRQWKAMIDDNEEGGISWRGVSSTF